MSTTLLGLIGPKNSGKSTLAKTLSISGFNIIPFAGCLKSMLKTMLSYQGVNEDEIEDRINGSLKEIPCEYFSGQTTRFLMQTLGTEWGRDIIHPQLWLEIWERKVNHLLSENLKIVCDDVRFVNEGELIQKLGGKLIYINRKGVVFSDHISENEFLKLSLDLIIQNPIEIGSKIESEMGKNMLFDELQQKYHMKFGEYL